MSEEKLVPKLRFSGFTENWQEFKFEDIYNVKNGLNKGKEYFGKGIQILNYMDVNKQELNSEQTIEGLVELSDKEIERYSVKPNDLFFTRTSETSDEIGLTSAYIGNSIKCVFSGFLLRARPKVDLNSLFFAYYLRTPKQRNNIIKFSSITTRALISGGNLSKMKINLPSIDEQNKIANLFVIIDKKVKLLEKKYQEYQDFKKYLMQQIFAQKLRFNTSSSYSNYKLKDIVTKFSTGLNPRKNFKLNEGGENFYVTIKNFQNGILNLDDKCDKIDDNALKLINKRSDLKKDDLIFASIGRVGEVYLIKNNPINWNINESVFSLRPNKQFIEPKFLYYLLNSTKIQNYFESNITGSTFKSIKMKDLKNTPVTIPDSFELQNKIIQFLSSVDSKIVLVDNELNNIQKFKKGLLQQMFV